MNKDLKGKKILLIGGAGFIGHNLALKLKAAEAEVFITDGLQVNNLVSLYNHQDRPAERNLYLSILNQRFNLLDYNEIPLYVDDARDYFRLDKIFRKIKPNVVILLAAVSHASRSNKDPFSTFDHSFRTLENALDCSRNHSIDHFI